MKKNATEKDPWGLEYTKQNTAGSGAYKVTSWTAGHRSHLRAQRQLEGRPAAQGEAHHLAHGAVGRQPPRAAGARRRRHLLRSAEQGFRRAEGRRQAQHRLDAVLERHPVYRHERHASRRSTIRRCARPSPTRSPTRRSWTRCCSASPSRCSARPPTRRPKSRGRSRTSSTPTSPRPRQLLAEAGYPNGFETTLSFDLGFAGVNEPLCVLMQESLAQIGIKSTINKIPGATGAPS